MGQIGKTKEFSMWKYKYSPDYFLFYPACIHPCVQA